MVARWDVLLGLGLFSGAGCSFQGGKPVRASFSPEDMSQLQTANSFHPGPPGCFVFVQDFLFLHAHLVGGFNPSQKFESNWIIFSCRAVSIEKTFSQNHHLFMIQAQFLKAFFKKRKAASHIAPLFCCPRSHSSQSNTMGVSPSSNVYTPPPQPPETFPTPHESPLRLGDL